jgi:four helix bundle protein
VNKKAPRDIQERTFEFGVRIVKLVDRLPRTLAATEIGRQVLRSGTSVGANMEEAKGAESKRDFIHKTNTAYKEARETYYWLGLIDAAILPGDKEVLALRQECDEIIRILHAILRKSRANLREARSANSRR